LRKLRPGISLPLSGAAFAKSLRTIAVLLIVLALGPSLFGAPKESLECSAVAGASEAFAARPAPRHNPLLQPALDRQASGAARGPRVAALPALREVAVFEEFLLRKYQAQAYLGAQQLALRQLTGADDAPATLELLRGPAMQRLGTLPDGRGLDVALPIAHQTGLVIGAPGSGKTRFVIELSMAALRWSLGQRPDAAVGPETFVLRDELVDLKGETVDEVGKHIAALYLRSDDAMRERLSHSVQLIEWSRDTVAASAPFDNVAGTVSDAFLADLRTGIEVAVSAQTYTDGVRQVLFMLYRLLIAKRFPPNYRFCQRFIGDAAFRARVLEGVRDADVRAYFAHLDDVLPRQTGEALLRRIQYSLSFPEIRLSTGIPPAALDRLLPKTEPLLTLGNFGPGVSLPPSKARERASHQVVDTVLAAQRHGSGQPRRLIIEEAAALLSTAGELVEPLANTARLSRSFNFGVVYAAQDFANALPNALVETLTLNSHWWAIFQSRKEGEWIAPYAVDASEGAKGRTAFVERVRALPRQHYYFYAKRGRALAARALDVVAPEAQARRSADELREIFRTRVARHSLISARVAEAEIERWEAEVVDAVPVTTPKPGRRAPRGIADFLTELDGDADA